MSVRIELDHPSGTGHVFTCLDYVSGKVILNIPSEETISSVTIKLEGISRTRLESPRLETPGERARDKRRAEVEIHKFLYIVHTVFPAPAVSAAVKDNTTGFTLKAGQYTYPFRIRIPINAVCTNAAGSLLQKVSFDIPNRTVDYAKQSMRHVKGTLPPSLSGIPGDIAWIKYFLKATVNRPAFYKTNLRQYDPFVFLPIESPRPPPTNAEAFARRKHEFIPAQPQPATKKPGLFMSFRKPGPAAVGPPVPVRFTVEARLPSPPILVPNEPLPLRILLTKLDPFHDVVVIRSLQIMLLATTHISAHELVKDEFTELCLLSVADLRMQLGDANSPPNVPLEVDASMWRGKYLPETLSPTFSTCNISRAYQLKIEIGLSRPDEQHIDILPLLFPIKVYSGIKPPAQLIASAAPRVPSQPVLPPRPTWADEKAQAQPHSSSLKVPLVLPTGGKTGSYSASASPVSSPASPHAPPLPMRPHSSAGPGPGLGPVHQVYNDYNAVDDDSPPPPTYEDAIADDIAPVDGPRRRYQQEGAYYQPLPDDVGDH